jgi:serine/threonine protein kinase
MDQLGPYKLVDTLQSAHGSGIYLARDQALGIDVVIKTIKAAEATPELMERFYQEARVCGRLSHPNIVSVYRLGEQQGTAFLAMERLEGEDLQQFISRKAYLPLETKIDLMIQICEGLHHAHTKGVIHRDIKPSNMFLETSGKVKILDFGTARVKGSTLTEMGRPLGTPKYMPPEQTTGEIVSEQSDIFSTAVVCYEFLAYAHPFSSPLSAPMPLGQFNSALPQKLDAAIMRALAKNPAERFRSALDFANALRDARTNLREQYRRFFATVSDLKFRIADIISDLVQHQQYRVVQSHIESGQLDLTVVDRIDKELGDPDLDYSRLATLHEEIRNLHGFLRGVQNDLKDVLDFEESRRQRPKTPTPAPPLPPPQPSPPPSPVSEDPFRGAGLIPDPPRPPGPTPKPGPAGERCRKCGTINPVHVVTCENCSTRLRRGPVPAPRPVMPKWPIAIVSTLLLALIAILYFGGIRDARPGPDPVPPPPNPGDRTAKNLPPPKADVIGSAKMSRTITTPSGLVLNDQTGVQIVGPLPPELQWDSLRSIEIQVGAKQESVPLDALTAVKTQSPKFDLWHARRSCPEPERCLERVEILYQALGGRDAPTLIFLAEAYAQRARVRQEDPLLRARAEQLLADIGIAPEFQKDTERIRGMLGQAKEDYPTLVGKSRKAKDDGDCKLAIELANKALTYLNEVMIPTSEAQRIKTECGQ